MRVFHPDFFRWLLYYVTLRVLGLSLAADIPLDPDQEWNLYGRFRLRMEQDNDEDPLRGNRTRIRVGNYAGIRFTPNEQWTFNLRGRLGDRRDPRIVDMTVYTREDFSYGRRGVFADQWFAKYAFAADTSLTVGRASMPFWANTEKLWDGDLTPLGGSLISRLNSGANPLRLSVGGFHMPDGMEHFHAWMQAVQLTWTQIDRKWNWRWGISLYNRPGEKGDRHLLLGEGGRDYLIGMVSAQFSGQLLERPAYVGMDIFENIENYSANDPDSLSSTFRDETTGVALAFNLGENKKQGDWRFRYVYAHVEFLAAMASYTTTNFGWLQRSNVTLHDFRADYSFTDKWRVTGRVSPAKEIIGSRSSTRFRIDFSRSF